MAALPYSYFVICILCHVTCIDMYVCLFVCFHVVTTLWLYFHNPVVVLTSSFSRFLDHTQRRATVGRTSLDEWPIRRRDIYLTTHNSHNRQTTMPPVGFEPTISAGERPKTYAYCDRHLCVCVCVCVCVCIYI